MNIRKGKCQHLFADFVVMGANKHFYEDREPNTEMTATL